MSSESDNSQSKAQTEAALEQERNNMENAKKEALAMLQALTKKEYNAEKQNNKANDVLQQSDRELSKGGNSH